MAAHTRADTHAPGAPADMDASEWETRVELAACYRLVARCGMDSLIYNHITARVPGHPRHFLINPFGLMYEEITASSLLKVDLGGQVIARPDLPYGFFLMYALEMACRLQLDLLSSGAELVPIPREVQEKSARVLGGAGVQRRSETEGKLGDWNGRREWAALLRQLDRADRSYAT